MAMQFFDRPELDVACDDSGCFWSGIVDRLALWAVFLTVKVDRNGLFIVLAKVEDRHCVLSGRDGCVSCWSLLVFFSPLPERQGSGKVQRRC